MSYNQLDLEMLEKIEALGFKLFGSTFKDSLAYIQIQRKKKELSSGNKLAITLNKRNTNY